MEKRVKEKQVYGEMEKQREIKRQRDEETER